MLKPRPWKYFVAITAPLVCGIWWSQARFFAGGAPDNIHVEAVLNGQFGTGGTAWSPDGLKIAAFTLNGTKIIVWNGPVWKISTIIDRHGQIYGGNALSFINNGSELAAPPDYPPTQGVVGTIYDPTTGTVLRNILTETGSAVPQTISYAAQKKILAVGSWNIDFFSTETWTHIGHIDHPKSEHTVFLSNADFSADGNVFAIARLDGSVFVFNTTDPANPQLIRKIDAFSSTHDSATSVALSPSGELVACGTGLIFNHKRAANGDDIPIRNPSPVKVFRVTDGSLVTSFHDAAQPIRSVAWSPTGSVIAFNDDHWRLYFWDVAQPNSPPRRLQLAEGARIAFSPDGSRLAASSDSQVVVVSTK